MEFKHSVFKRKAKSDHRKGKWYLRLRWQDSETGVWRSTERQYEKRIEAIESLPKIELEIRTTAGRFRAGSDMPFSELAALCERSFYHEATYEAGLKTGGVKSLSTVKAAIKHLTDHFKNRPIGRITEADLRKYREWRKQRGSQNPSLVKKGVKKDVSPGTINRELGVCRRMFNFALDQGFIPRDIFRKAKAIHKRLEKPRTRVLTHGEIDRLLEACEAKATATYKRRRRAGCTDRPGEFDEIEHKIEASNAFMKPAILLACDSGLRKGEILSLRWSDVDLEGRRVRLRPEITKTETERVEGLTKRTIDALREIEQFRLPEKDAFIFVSALNKNLPMADLGRPWKKVLKLAGLEDVTFHDLRRTAATVLVRDLGLGVEFAAKLLGHSEGSQITLRHYVAADDAAIEHVVSRLDELHRRRSVINVEGMEN